MKKTEQKTLRAFNLVDSMQELMSMMGWSNQELARFLCLPPIKYSRIKPFSARRCRRIKFLPNGNPDLSFVRKRPRTDDLDERTYSTLFVLMLGNGIMPKADDFIYKRRELIVASRNAGFGPVGVRAAFAAHIEGANDENALRIGALAAGVPFCQNGATMEYEIAKAKNEIEHFLLVSPEDSSAAFGKAYADEVRIVTNVLIQLEASQIYSLFGPLLNAFNELQKILLEQTHPPVKSKNEKALEKVLEKLSKSDE